MRSDFGPGYGVNFKKRGKELIILLAEGDKSRQSKDMEGALRPARDLME
jgi:putative addiction module killer protein